MFVSSTYRITGFQNTYRCSTLTAAYVRKLLLKKQLARLHLLKYEPYVQLMFVSSSYRITGSQHTYSCATLNAAYVCELYLQNYWVTLYLWVFNFKSILCLLSLPTESFACFTLMVRNLKWTICLQALFTESLGYTILMAAPT